MGAPDGQIGEAAVDLCLGQPAFGNIVDDGVEQLFPPNLDGTAVNLDVTQFPISQAVLKVEVLALL